MSLRYKNVFYGGEDCPDNDNDNEQHIIEHNLYNYKLYTLFNS